MEHDFAQTVWDDRLVADCQALVQLAFAEDLGGQNDWTTAALVDPLREGNVLLAAREPGVAAGLRTAEIVAAEFGAKVAVRQLAKDGETFAAGAALAEVSGNAGDLLTMERTTLNLVGRLCGIATLARQYADSVIGTNAQVYDTRKTTPGWRRLEKYAVRCGGCRNHRTGLFDAVLIKDNHLAQLAGDQFSMTASAAQAVTEARRFAEEHGMAHLPLEVEVDSLDQLRAVLPTRPDIVLLDNMTVDELRQAVALRDGDQPDVDLECSGGVTLESLREIAETGVERISVGRLTHAARSLDVGFDWNEA